MGETANPPHQKMELDDKQFEALPLADQVLIREDYQYHR